MDRSRRRRRPRDEEEDERPSRSSRSSSSKSSSKGRSLKGKTYDGLSEERMASKQGSGKRLFLPKDKTVPVVFLDLPSEMKEYDQHVWKEGNKWNFVPCAESADGDCPFCADDDPAIAKTSYGFACNVWDVKNKCVRVMTGPTKLSTLILKRWKSRKERFKKIVFDVTQLDTKPVGYDVDSTEDRLPVIKGEKYDLQEFIDEEIQNFMARYGGDSGKGRSSLEDPDDDDDESDDDEGPHTKEELMDMEWRELKKLARSLDIDTDDKKRRTLVAEIMEAEE